MHENTSYLLKSDRLTATSNLTPMGKVGTRAVGPPLECVG